MKTPVRILLIFNRPEATRAVFQTIRDVRPPKLLLVADGPRADRPGERELCVRARAEAQAIDWPCEVLTRFAPENLGCRQNVSTGLDWAFTQVEEAIVLEDDCLPDQSFFRFCEELLARYRDNSRVSQICGSNYQQGIRRTPYSYYFTRHAHIWGWATWRRSWQEGDLSMSAWPELRDGGWLKRYLDDPKSAFFWTKLFNDSQRPRRDSLNSWAIPWTFSRWSLNKLSIIPEVNLITNIGHSAEGTHTTDRAGGNRTPLGQMDFPLQHPPTIEPHVEADRYTEHTFYYGYTLLERFFWADGCPFRCRPSGGFAAS